MEINYYKICRLWTWNMSFEHWGLSSWRSLSILFCCRRRLDYAPLLNFNVQIFWICSLSSCWHLKNSHICVKIMSDKTILWCVRSKNSKYFIVGFVLKHARCKSDFAGFFSLYTKKFYKTNIWITIVKDNWSLKKEKNHGSNLIG